MNVTILLIAMILMWIAVIIGTWQRIFQMPKWFSDPPASFELIRRQSKKAKSFWIPLSILFVICASTSLILNWQYQGIRDHIIGGLVCYIATGILSGVYFVKEILSFSKMSPDAPRTPELIQRTKRWLRWTTVRDVLQFLAAIFLTIAYRHA